MNTPSTSHTNTKPPRLDDAEIMILVGAANRPDRIALPVPDSLSVDPDKIASKLKRLLRLKLLDEIPAKLEDGRWRKDDEDRHIILRITEAGLKAAQLDEENDAVAPPATPASPPAGDGSKRRKRGVKQARAAKPPTTARAHKSPPASMPASSGRGSSKTEALLKLLRRTSGATLPELMKASGWQAHSVRGFLSATVKTKLKLKLASEVNGKRVRRYRVKGGKA